jgi:uncharacterized phage protein (TIGR01671 family)
MKREIKFRGWHSEQKKMFSAEEMAIDQLTILTTGSFINVSGADVRLSTIYPNDIFIPLQFTGLHDKNGKEIYEGDILSMDNPHYGYGDPDEKGYRLYVVDDIIDFHYDYMEHCISHDAIVIGNIYENPELIKS